MLRRHQIPLGHSYRVNVEIDVNIDVDVDVDVDVTMGIEDIVKYEGHGGRLDLELMGGQCRINYLFPPKLKTNDC
jgi:hypothetical protein